MSRKSAGRPRKDGRRMPCGALAVVASATKSGRRRVHAGYVAIDDYGTDEVLIRRASLVDPDLVQGLRMAMENVKQLNPSPGDAVAKAAVKASSAAKKQIRDMASDRRLSYVLGILYARKTITGGQHYAGNRYAGLYVTSSYRAVRQQSVLGKMVGGSSGNPDNQSPQEAEDAAAKQRESYLSARRALLKAGFTAAGIVDSVCVFEQLPLFKQLDDFRMGLDILRDHFEAEGRKR